MLKPDAKNTGTRVRIIEEACQLIQLGGTAYLNLDQIAKTLKITRPALYFHFPGGRDQLLVEVFKAWGTELGRHLDEILRENPDACTRLRKILLGVNHRPFPDKRELILAKMDKLTEQVQQELKKIFLKPINIVTMVIQEGIQKGEFKPVDPNIAFYSYMGLIHQLEQYQDMLQHLPPDIACKFPEDVDEMGNRLLDIWFGGMLASGALLCFFAGFFALVRK